MTFYQIQKKQKVIGDFLGNVNFDPLFRPPRKPQKSSILAIFGHFSDPLKPPKTPKNPQNGQNSRKWPFLTKFAFLAKNYEDLISKTPLFDPPWGIAHPPKNGPFWPPQGKSPKLPFFRRFLAIFWSKSGDVNGILAPLARLPISNNRVIRPQIWNLRRKRGFSVPPQVREMWVLNLGLKNPNY